MNELDTRLFEMKVRNFAVPRKNGLIDVRLLKSTKVRLKGKEADAYRMSEEDFWDGFTKRIESSLSAKNRLSWRLLILYLLDKDND